MRHRFFMLILLSCMAFLIISGCNQSNPTPRESVIDLAYTVPDSYLGFGKDTDEIRRWDVFTANAYPRITKIELKIFKRPGDTGQSDVTVKLYPVTNNLPSGTFLAATIIPADSFTESTNITTVPLTYDGLENGRMYAIVLGQEQPQANHYCWDIGYISNSTGTYFGKYNGVDWIDESSEGRGWLKVYVSR